MLKALESNRFIRYVLPSGMSINNILNKLVSTHISYWDRAAGSGQNSECTYRFTGLKQRYLGSLFMFYASTNPMDGVQVV